LSFHLSHKQICPFNNTTFAKHLTCMYRHCVKMQYEDRNLLSQSWWLWS